MADVSGQGRMHQYRVDGGCALDGGDHLSRNIRTGEVRTKLTLSAGFDDWLKS